MVTLRSGKAVPYLGKNMPKRKTAKKTKKKQTKKSTATAVVQKDDTVETNESIILSLHTFSAGFTKIPDGSRKLICKPSCILTLYTSLSCAGI